MTRIDSMTLADMEHLETREKTCLIYSILEVSFWVVVLCLWAQFAFEQKIALAVVFLPLYALPVIRYGWRAARTLILLATSKRIYRSVLEAVVSSDEEFRRQVLRRVNLYFRKANHVLPED